MPKKQIKRNNPLRWNPSRAQLFITSGVLMIVLLILVAQVQLPQSFRGNTQTLTNCTVSESELAIDSQEQAMLDLINNYRQQHGAPLLTFSPNLIRAATWLSLDMSTHNNLSHTDSFNRTFAVRLTNCGYSEERSGENIARNGPAEDTFQGWVSSPAHNTNMLNPQYTVAGIARSGQYWTLDLGATDQPQPSTAATPTFGVIVPCPSCTDPTGTPSVTQPIETDPTEGPEPTAPEEGEQQPTVSPAPSTNTPAPNGNNNGGGLIELLLNFLKAILELFLSLLGR